MAHTADQERPTVLPQEGCPVVSDVMWYVAYGSNLARDRLQHYLAGGRPRGALRTYDGCRDPSEPLATRPVPFRGGLLFAGRSRVWTGGMAFIDPDGHGTVAGRGYLLAPQQVNDLVAQELRLPWGTDVGLLHDATLRHSIGTTAAYDTALRLEDIDGVPAVTITSSRPPVPSAPSAAYLRWVVVGLRETYGWSPTRITDYLADAAGVGGAWPKDRLGDVVRSAVTEAPADT